MNGILKRKVFFVRIRFTSPLSISSGEDEWTDSDILKDCDGTPFVPGSSLAGSMRAYLEKEKNAPCMMGYTDREDTGKMSSLFISDLTLDKEFTIDLARDDMAEAVEDAFRYGKLVLATITYNGDIFPFMRTYIENLTERSYQNRTIGLIENGSWAPAAARVMQGMFEKSKNITWLENNVKIMSSLSEANEAEIEAMAEELCK